MLILIGEVKVNCYFPVFVNPNYLYQFNQDTSIKALNIFMFQECCQIRVIGPDSIIDCPHFLSQIRDILFKLLYLTRHLALQSSVVAFLEFAALPVKIQAVSRIAILRQLFFRLL